MSLSCHLIFLLLVSPQTGCVVLGVYFSGLHNGVVCAALLLYHPCILADLLGPFHWSHANSIGVILPCCAWELDISCLISMLIILITFLLLHLDDGIVQDMLPSGQ